jgi:hypothetical protein
VIREGASARPLPVAATGLWSVSAWFGVNSADEGTSAVQSGRSDSIENYPVSNRRGDRKTLSVCSDAGRALAKRHSLKMKTLPSAVEDVCYRRKSGKYLLVPNISQSDPTETSSLTNI